MLLMLTYASCTMYYCVLRIVFYASCRLYSVLHICTAIHHFGYCTSSFFRSSRPANAGGRELAGIPSLRACTCQEDKVTPHIGSRVENVPYLYRGGLYSELAVYSQLRLLQRHTLFTIARPLWNVDQELLCLKNCIMHVISSLISFLSIYNSLISFICAAVQVQQY